MSLWQHRFRIMCCCLLACLPGCNKQPTARPLPTGMKFEVYRVATAKTDPTQTISYPDSSGASIQVEAKPILVTADIAAVMVTDLPQTAPKPGEAPSLEVTLTNGGAGKLGKATAAAQGSIAVVINGQVVCAPRVNLPLGSKFRITGDANNPSLSGVIGKLAAPRRK